MFVLLQILTPIHQAMSANLGDRTAAWLYDRLTEACVRPPGMGHLEDPSLTSDLTVARDFDLGMTGPPLSFSMDFIAGGMVEMIGGLAAAAVLFAYAWWAPLVLGGAWLSTQWLLRESAVWWDRNTPEVRAAQRDADYTYRLAVDPGPAKELRLFGLVGWTIERFVERRTRLHALQYEATRLREKPMVWSLLIVLGANVLVFWSLASAAIGGRISLAEVVVFAQAAVGVSLIAFGGFSWALDGAAAPVAAVLRLEGRWPRPARSRRHGRHRRGRAAATCRRVRSASATSRSPTRRARPCSSTSISPSPPARRIAIVGQNGAGKTTLAKLLCRLYDPQSGAIEVDGVDLRELDVAAWRARVTAVFQDFIRLRAAAARQRRAVGRTRRGGARRARVGRRGRRSPASTRFSRAATPAAPICRADSGSASRSRGRSPRCSSAPASCCSTSRPRSSTCAAKRRSSSGSSPRRATARRSSSRTASRPCARPIASACSKRGRVVELGTHDELMALGGRYQTMFDLQAQRFNAAEDEEGKQYDVLA